MCVCVYVCVCEREKSIINVNSICTSIYVTISTFIEIYVHMDNADIHACTHRGRRRHLHVNKQIYNITSTITDVIRICKCVYTYEVYTSMYVRKSVSVHILYMYKLFMYVNESVLKFVCIYR